MSICVSVSIQHRLHGKSLRMKGRTVPRLLIGRPMMKPLLWLNRLHRRGRSSPETPADDD